MNNNPIPYAIDCSGLKCPMPLLKAKLALGSLEPEQKLDVLLDDPGSINDLPRWARRIGAPFELTPTPVGWRFRIEKPHA